MPVKVQVGREEDNFTDLLIFCLIFCLKFCLKFCRKRFEDRASQEWIQRPLAVFLQIPQHLQDLENTSAGRRVPHGNGTIDSLSLRKRLH